VIAELGHGLQPLRLLGHRRPVPALAGQQQPDHPQQQLRLPLPALRHRRSLGQGQVPLDRLQRPLRQLIFWVKAKAPQTKGKSPERIQAA
jgi:hypothetical protein